MAAPACRGCISCLMARVEESSSKLLEAERRLQEERQRAVLLEQHLEKMRLEPSRASLSQKAKNKPGRSSVGDTASGTGGYLCSSSVGVGALCVCCGGLLAPCPTAPPRDSGPKACHLGALTQKTPVSPPHATVPCTGCQSLCLVLERA